MTTMKQYSGNQKKNYIKLISYIFILILFSILAYSDLCSNNNSSYYEVKTYTNITDWTSFNSFSQNGRIQNYINSDLLSINNTYASKGIGSNDGRSTPLILNNFLYVGTAGGNLLQLDATNISKQINVYSTGNYILSSPYYANGYIYIGGYNGYVYQFNYTNISNYVNRFQTASGVYSTPLVVGEYLYISSMGGFFQLNATNISKQINKIDGFGAHSSPSYYNGYIYTTGGNNIYQLNATNISKIINTYITGSLSYSFVMPLIYNDYLYFPASDGYLYQLNATNISKLYQRQYLGAMYASPSLANDILYVASFGNGALYQINPQNVSNITASINLGQLYTSSPSVINGYVYIGSWNFNLYQLDATNISKIIFTKATSQSIQTPVASYNGFIYYVNNDALYQLFQPIKYYCPSINFTSYNFLNVFRNDVNYLEVETQSYAGSFNITKINITLFNRYNETINFTEVNNSYSFLNFTNLNNTNYYFNAYVSDTNNKSVKISSQIDLYYLDIIFNLNTTSNGTILVNDNNLLLDVSTFSNNNIESVNLELYETSYNAPKWQNYSSSDIPVTVDDITSNFDGSVFFTLDSGGYVYRGNTVARTLTPLNNIGIDRWSSIDSDDNFNYIYMCTGYIPVNPNGRVLRSNNSGVNWSDIAIYNIPCTSIITSYDGKTITYTTDYEGSPFSYWISRIIQSNDYGNTFTTIYNITYTGTMGTKGFFDLKMSRNGQYICAYSPNGGLHRYSNDFGISFSYWNISNLTIRDNCYDNEPFYFFPLPSSIPTKPYNTGTQTLSQTYVSPNGKVFLVPYYTLTPNHQNIYIYDSVETPTFEDNTTSNLFTALNYTNYYYKADVCDIRHRCYSTEIRYATLVSLITGDCFDKIKNYNEVDVDYGGRCGQCKNFTYVSDDTSFQVLLQSNLINEQNPFNETMCDEGDGVVMGYSFVIFLLIILFVIFGIFLVIFLLFPAISFIIFGEFRIPFFKKKNKDTDENE